MFKLLNAMINIVKRYHFNKKNIKVGKGTKILTNYLNLGQEPYLIEIGKNCTITSGVKFLAHDDSISVCYRYLDIDRFKGNLAYEKASRIKIGNNVFIGINAIILPGVVIGDNVIIGAGSIVSKSIPSNSVAVGSPIRIISNIEEYYNKVEKDLILINQDNREEDLKIKCK